MTSHFTQYMHLLKQLNDLMKAGKDEGEEGEKIRGQMDYCWNNMTPDERAKTRGGINQ